MRLAGRARLVTANSQSNLITNRELGCISVRSEYIVTALVLIQSVAGDGRRTEVGVMSDLFAKLVSVRAAPGDKQRLVDRIRASDRAKVLSRKRAICQRVPRQQRCPNGSVI